MCVLPPFQQILIDGAGHLLGRLASIVAKSTLQGMCVSRESLVDWRSICHQPKLCSADRMV